MAEAVTAIRGTAFRLASAFSRRATPKPSSFGRARSHRIRSGLVRNAASTPSSPSRAAMVVWPYAFKRYVISSRFVGLSSITRMRLPISGPRKRQDEGAAPAEFTRETDRATKEFGQLLTEVEPEPGPIVPASRAELRERLEHLLLVLGLDAHAGIDDPDLDYAVI